MDVRMYSVFDLRSKTFGFPFQSMNDDVAMRDFSAFVRNEKNIISQFPEDFELWFCGLWSDMEGEAGIRADEKAHRVMRASECKRKLEFVDIGIEGRSDKFDRSKVGV